jgi:predicted nucleotidyltransferase
MSRSLSVETAEAVSRIAERERLSLVLLFGSRVRGTAGPASDTDIGVAARRPLAPEQVTRIYTQLSLTPGLTNVDVVDLTRAPSLLRFEAARTGTLLYESAPGVFSEFRVRAWKQMLDDEIDFGRLNRQVVTDALKRWRA